MCLFKAFLTPPPLSGTVITGGRYLMGATTNQLTGLVPTRERVMAVMAPQVWNSLSREVRQAPPLHL